MKIKPERHLLQLDGLRTVAIAAVIWSHWADNYTFGLPLGTGVQLFFVLSGFLITGILLDNKVELSQVGTVLKQFYIRRALRIFPLFYGTIAIAVLLNAPPIRATWPWHISYLSNFYYVHQGRWDPAANYFGHFWSLSVEEQFYFVWPFLVLFLTRTNICRALVSLIILAPVVRVTAHTVMSNEDMVHLLPFSNLDALATGGLFAFLMRFRETTGITSAKFSTFCLYIGLPLALLGAAGHRLPYPIFAIAHTGLILFYGWVVYRGAIGFGGLLGGALSNPFIVYLGKISYGLYVFHHFVPGISRYGARWIGAEGELERSFPLRFALNCLIMLALAMLSWHFFECPINDLKRFFPYRKTPKEKILAENLAETNVPEIS
jgi:peptidoglycan/LPS O-acetylase OafA/YrhL